MKIVFTIKFAGLWLNIRLNIGHIDVFRVKTVNAI